MTELIQGICSFDAICTSRTIIVPYVLTKWKRLCPFALSCWDVIAPGRARVISSFDEILLISNQLPKELAMDIIVMSCWGIWSVRNDKIFRFAPPAIDSWKFYLAEGLWTVQLRAKEGKGNRIKDRADLNL